MKATAAACAKAIVGGVAKAIVGGVVTGLAMAAEAAADQDGITSGEWWRVAAATAAAAYAVWQMPNTPAE
jgi:hypothetical protein